MNIKGNPNFCKGNKFSNGRPKLHTLIIKLRDPDKAKTLPVDLLRGVATDNRDILNSYQLPHNKLTQREKLNAAGILYLKEKRS